MKGTKFVNGLLVNLCNKIWLLVDFTNIPMRKMRSHLDHCLYSYFTAMC